MPKPKLRNYDGLYARVPRRPIILSKNMVAFLQIFEKNDENPDWWFFSESYSWPNYRAMARQFVAQFQGKLSLALAVAMAEAFKSEAEKHISKFDMDTTYEEVLNKFIGE